MAESIGKVVVSIEARVEELEKGMAKAEATVRRSAAKIEANQKTLTNKIGKSWTEMSSKLLIIGQVANIAEKAWNTLDGVLTVVTDSTKNASNKIMGSMEVMEQSSIPVVSQFMKIGHGIHGWVSGEKKLRAEIDKTNAALEQRYDREHKALDQRRQAREALEGFIQGAAKSIETENAAIKETTSAGKLRLEQDAERIALQDEYTKKLAQVNPYKTTEEFFKRTEDAFNTAMGQLQETHHLEMSLAKEADRSAAQAEEARLKAIDDQALARIKAAEDEAKHLAKIAQQVQNQTDDLQTRLTQLSLEDLGLDLESKLTGIHAKFDRLRQNANAEQIALLNQIEAIENKRAKAVHSETTARENDRKAAEAAKEKAADKSKLVDLTTQVTVATLEAAGAKMSAELVSMNAKFTKMREGATVDQLTQIAKLEKLEKAAISEKHKPEPVDESKGQVSSIQTALGSFTVGLDHQAVTAKQTTKNTSLLSAIASASPKTANAATKQVTLLEKVNGWLAKITEQEVVVKPDIKAEAGTNKLSVFTDLVKKITEQQDDMRVTIEPSESALANSEVKIVDQVNVQIPERQISLLTDIADKSGDKAMMKVMEKIAESSAKVANALSSPSASGIIIAS